MKHSIKSLIAIAALGATALLAPAQTLKVGTLDINKALDGYWKTQEERAVIEQYQQRAREGTEKILNEGRELAKEFEEAKARSESAIASEQARKDATVAAQATLQKLQQKEQDRQQFVANANQTIQNQLETSRRKLLEKITEVAAAAAKRKGITLLLEKSNGAVITVVYSDPGFEITDDVITELNKDRPANFTTGTAAPAAAAATGSATGPSINF
ncbi:MAG: OmpH family outer membrane protein [Opitutaceae bacterium]|jgi:outer membrane protein|nr:OmpH family outer membrane protein [Opitutaceae bacterium]